MYRILEEPENQTETQSEQEIPQTMEDFIADMKNEKPDAKTFAIKLKAMVHHLILS